MNSCSWKVSVYSNKSKESGVAEIACTEIIPWPDAGDAPGRRKPRALEKTEMEMESGQATLDGGPHNSEQAGEGDEGLEEKMDEDELTTPE